MGLIGGQAAPRRPSVRQADARGAAGARARATAMSTLGKVRALVDAVDQAGYDAVAGTDTPRLDPLLVAVSNAANYSRLWLVTAAAVAVVGGAPGRRAAGQGVLASGVAPARANLA